MIHQVKVISTLAGGHVQVRVYAGPYGRTLAHNGHLAFLPSEYQDVAKALGLLAASHRDWATSEEGASTDDNRYSEPIE